MLQVRQGIPLIHLLSMEDLFCKYGVDIGIWAHEHSYERLWPVYDRKVKTIQIHYILSLYFFEKCKTVIKMVIKFKIILDLVLMKNIQPC